MKESNKTEQDLLIEVQGDQLRFEEKRLQQQQEKIKKQTELIAEQTKMSQILSKETI